MAYKKGIVDGWWEEYKTEYVLSSSAFFSVWADTFANLDVSLVAPDQGERSTDEAVAFDVVIKTAPGDGASWFGVVDAHNQHRAIILQEVKVGITNWSLIGGICYFDEQGKKESSEEPMEQEWFRFDCRRPPFPEKETLVLCGNIICYVTAWGGMDGWILKEDKPVGKFKDLRKWHEGGQTMVWQMRPQQEIVDGRWFCYLCESRKIHFCVDLKSIRQNPDTSNRASCVLYDTVSIPAENELRVALDALTDMPSYEITERDGYPLLCAACGGDVVNGHLYRNGQCPFGLGLAACPTCLIRFSKSQGQWTCWQIVPAAATLASSSGLDECNCVVHGPDYKCSMEHANVSMNITTKPKKRGTSGSDTIRVDVKRVKTDEEAAFEY